MKPWSLRRRLWTAFTVVGLASVLTIGAATISVVALRSAQRQVTSEIFSSYAASNDLFLALLNQETGVRGYLAAGREELLEPYTTGRTEAAAARLRLLAAQPESETAREELSQTLSSVDAWTVGFAEPALEARRAGGPSAVTDTEADRGRELFNAFRSDLRTFQASVLGSRSDAEQRLSRTTTVLVGVLAAGALGLLAVGALLWLALTRWVTRPLEDLASEVLTVTEHDLEHPVVVDGPPDIELLGQGVEAMRRRVVAAYTHAITTQAQIEDARLELAHQAEDLRRSNAELEQFAYVASHDLQEPLRKVASFTRMLQQRYAGQLDERADTYIDFAADGAKRMQQLINDLLAFSRVGRISSGFSEVELDVALSGAMRSLAARIEETSAQVEQDPLPRVCGELSLLTQLFQNLLGNAMKFSGEAVPRIEVRVRRVMQEWEIAVSDNGIGIEPQYAERIFVIFQRLHPKDEYEGTGIGLALCRKIVEYHSGKIWLDDGASGGATFRFTLPALEQQRSLPGSADD